MYPHDNDEDNDGDDDNNDDVDADDKDDDDDADEEEQSVVLCQAHQPHLSSCPGLSAEKGSVDCPGWSG